MAPQQWVKFHAALTKGSKRALTRATRFVFLELCLQARDLDGAIELRADLDLPAAVYDIIGGNLVEIGEAISALVSAGMVVVEDQDDRRIMLIPSWERWNSQENSTERVARWRDKKRAEQPEPCVYFVQRDDGAIKIGFTDTLALRLHSLRADHGSLQVLATMPGGRDVEGQMHHKFRHLRIGTRGEWFTPGDELLEHIAFCSGNAAPSSGNVSRTRRGEERRGEEKRGEERSACAREAAPPPSSEEESHIRAALMSSPLLSTAEGIEASAAGLAMKVRSLPPECRWSDLRAEADEWVAHARKAYQSAKDGGAHWSAERALAEVEAKAGQRIRYRPKDARLERERERARAAQWPDGSAKSPAAIETDSLDAEIAEADRRLAAERAKRETEPKVDPREMAKLTANVLAKWTKGAA